MRAKGVGLGWEGRQGYLAVVLGHAAMVCLCLICGKVGGLLTIVSSKQGSLGTFSRNTSSEELGVEER